MEPQIIVGYGAHASEYRPPRLERKGLYRDLSTVMIVPTRGTAPVRVIDAWFSMIVPPNQKFVRLWGAGMEVAEAYNQLVGLVLGNDGLKDWRYVLCVEEDNLMEPMALVELLLAADKGNFDVLGGLYWTKGETGVAQIWGEPDADQEHYRPLDPQPGRIVRCAATGMGFTLFKTDVFRRVEGPWFETVGDERGIWTQDLRFFSRARAQKVKLKVGVHCGVKVAHYDFNTGILW
jgi:hypothetical protein